MVPRHYPPRLEKSQTGLFSAAVATLVSVSIEDLRPNSQDTSAFYLKNIYIYQHLADTNVSRSSIPYMAATLPAFSPPRYAIWVNALWFLSLVISLTGAMLATLLHQWARRYIRVTQQPQCSPHKRARVRALFSNGVDESHVRWVVEGLPAMIHLSLFLFFAGLLIYLFNVYRPVFSAVLWWVALTTAAYLYITLLPSFRPNSPYYTPLSSAIWSLCAGIPYAVFKSFSSPLFSRSIPNTREHFDRLQEHYHKRLMAGIAKTAEEATWELSSGIDVRVLESAFDSVGEDCARAEFFEAIPGFYHSKLVKNLQEGLSAQFLPKFEQALDGFLDRTLSSNSICESVRSHRLVICLDAASAALGPDAVSRILYDILNGRWHEVFQSIEMGHALRRWGCASDELFDPYVRRIVTHIVTHVRERGESWISLVKAEFGVPDRILRSYVVHGDSVLLATLIHTTRYYFFSDFPPWDSDIGALFQSLSQFDIHNTLPGLQNDFCALWNEIVLHAQRGDAYSTSVFLLQGIRHLYDALHRGADVPLTGLFASPDDVNPIPWQPLSYPMCDNASHCPELAPPHHAHEVPVERAVHDPAHDSTSSPALDIAYDSQLPAAQSSFDNVPYASPPCLPPLPTFSFPVLESEYLRPDPPEFPTPLSVQVNSGIPTPSSTPNSIVRCTCSCGPTPQENTETTIASSPIVSSPVKLPIRMQGSASSTMLPTFAESAVARSDNTLGRVGSSSSFTTAPRSYAEPRVTSDLYSHVTTGIGTLATHHDYHDKQDLHPPILMGIPLRPYQSAPPALNIAVDALPPSACRHRLNYSARQTFPPSA